LKEGGKKELPSEVRASAPLGGGQRREGGKGEERMHRSRLGGGGLRKAEGGGDIKMSRLLGESPLSA